MDELVQFLGARLDEDEAVIEAPESWTEFEESQQGTRRVDVDHSIERVVACTRAWRGVHIARHDPAHVLRDIEAKRQLVARYERAMENRRAHPDDLASAGALLALHGAVKLLALPYADHPDYRTE